MRKTGLIALMFVLTAMLFGQNILLWDNDNYSSFIPPGGEFFQGCEVALGRSLVNNGLNYTETTILPGDLTQYDAVFVTLGVYCLSWGTTPPGTIGSVELDILTSYLSQGGSLYVEGVDFVNDYSGTPIMDYFGVTIGNNGIPAAINHVEGSDGSIAEGLDFNYLYGEYPDYGVDEITLVGANPVLVSNDNIVRVTSFESRGARTIASAIVMGGIYDDEDHTKAELMNAYIRYLLPTTSNDEDVVPSLTAELHPAYPNPFNPTTTISFSLPTKQSYTLKVYDVRGRLVTTLGKGIANAGIHKLTWNGTNDKNQTVNSGVYFARLITNGKSKTSKLTLIK